MKNRLGQAGDTIVEVLIAIAALAAITAGVYSAINQSQKVTQEAQERSEATKVVESQLESLKSIIRDGKKTVPVSAAFCVNSALTDFVAISGDPFSKSASTDSFPYTGDCGNRGGRYNVAIKYDSASNDTYTARARWDRVYGGGREELTMYYRVHQ